MITLSSWSRNNEHFIRPSYLSTVIHIISPAKAHIGHRLGSFVWRCWDYLLTEVHRVAVPTQCSRRSRLCCRTSAVRNYTPLTCSSANNWRWVAAYLLTTWGSFKAGVVYSAPGEGELVKPKSWWLVPPGEEAWDVHKRTTTMVLQSGVQRNQAPALPDINK